MKSIIAAAFLAGLVAADTPCNPPAGVTISTFQYSGDGCPQGSATSTISEDLTVRLSLLLPPTSMMDIL
jgi:hypothetical protein